MKYLKITLTTIVPFMLVTLTSCSEEKPPSQNNVAESNQIHGTWFNQIELLDGIGMAQIIMELHKDGTCDVSLVEDKINSTFSTESITQVLLKGSWLQKEGHVETKLKIKSWETKFPSGKMSKETFDEYDVIWLWQVDGSKLTYGKFDFLLFSKAKFKDDKGITVDNMIGGSKIIWNLRELQKKE